MFIAAVTQAGIKIGDLTHQAGMTFESHAEGLVTDVEMIGVPEGVEPGDSALSREDERALVRDSTAGFAGAHPRPDVCCGGQTSFCRLGRLTVQEGFRTVRESS
jgi:hypothetical protein